MIYNASYAKQFIKLRKIICIDHQTLFNLNHIKNYVYARNYNEIMAFKFFLVTLYSNVFVQIFLRECNLKIFYTQRKDFHFCKNRHF